ncbi:unnamed protein product [Coffea canephora]|uniref:Uncharacterized protein n=1 Tax=Coffea canephora TaxID=49390 RepID=A0A068UUF0_COFCA|nr:unnamed protein product [Coffea canephora]
MVRTTGIDKSGLKKGAWSEEEDNKLRAYVLRYGHWNWQQLPKFAGLSRCGKSCRLRWMNYLRPGVKRGSFSEEEEELILKLHKELGNRWSAITARLPGRTDNEVKNYWHTHLRKRTKQDSKPKDKIEQTSERSQPMESDADQNKESSAISIFHSTTDQNRSGLETEIAAVPAADTNCELSPLSCGSKHFDGGDWFGEDSNSSVESLPESFESFWSEPFALDTSYSNLKVINYDWLPPVEEEFTYPFSSFLDEDMDWFHELIQ